MGGNSSERLLCSTRNNAREEEEEVPRASEFPRRAIEAYHDMLKSFILRLLIHFLIVAHSSHRTHFVRSWSRFWIILMLVVLGG